jgi:dUTP pyrophosphatase
MRFLIKPGGVAPKRAHDNDAGFDLFIQPKKSNGLLLLPKAPLVIDTNVVVDLPDGWFAKIESRSSLALEGVIATGGVIDSDYVGTIKVILHNITDSATFILTKGAIAQLVLYPLFRQPVSVVDFDEQDAVIAAKMQKRGTKGFGSTNKEKK